MRKSRALLNEVKPSNSISSSLSRQVLTVVVVLPPPRPGHRRCAVHHYHACTASRSLLLGHQVCAAIAYSLASSRRVEQLHTCPHQVSQRFHIFGSFWVRRIGR
uniref:Uncharacterized protein n=1 Tax=Triticum urartu TaxID=4572 RepID=A0A8R7TUS5_TRIUA